MTEQVLSTATSVCIAAQVYNWCDAVYEGELLDGERHGYGTLTFAGSAVVYEGQWQFGKRHGSGTIHYNEQKTASYEGKKLLLVCTAWHAYE